jgi:hypothetical protein
VPPKERLRTDQERRPPSTGEKTAERCHEQPVAAAKSRPADLALENHQLVAEDRQFDVAVQIVRGAGDQPHHTTQQEIQQSEQHVQTSHDMKEGRSYERTGRGADRMVCVPFRVLAWETVPGTGRR